MHRLGCKCSAAGYCFTIEHNKEYTPTDIDIEYCEQVEEMGKDSAIIKFKQLDEVPKALVPKRPLLGQLVLIKKELTCLNHWLMTILIHATS